LAWRSLHGGFAEREIILRMLGPIREPTDEVIDFWRERIRRTSGPAEKCRLESWGYP